MDLRPQLAGALAAVLLLAPAAAQVEAASAALHPRQVSGAYQFLRKGEFLQLNIIEFVREGGEAGETGEGGSEYRVAGFLSRRGDSPSNDGAVLDHFMARGELRGNTLTFTTRTVHGVRFEFAGTVERGRAAAPTEGGYLVLRGRLTRYDEDAEGAITHNSREVALLSLPSDYSGDRNH